MSDCWRGATEDGRISKRWMTRGREFAAGRTVRARVGKGGLKARLQVAVAVQAERRRASRRGRQAEDWWTGREGGGGQPRRETTGSGTDKKDVVQGKSCPRGKMADELEREKGPRCSLSRTSQCYSEGEVVRVQREKPRVLNHGATSEGGRGTGEAR